MILLIYSAIMHNNYRFHLCIYIISKAIIILLENEEMMLFQEKYLQVILKMTNSEVKAAITYTKDILRTQKNI